MAGPADAASLRLASPSEPSRFERPMRAGQAAPTCDVRERESGFGPSWLSRLLRSTLAQMRCGDATPPDGSRPTGSSGARWRDPPQGGPTPTGSFGSSGDRSLHHRDRISVERPGAHGFDPGSDSYRALRAACPFGVRGSIFHPPSPGSSPGEHRGRTAGNSDPAPGLRQRSKALRPAAASGVGAAVRNRDDDQRSDLRRREGIARR